MNIKDLSNKTFDFTIKRVAEIIGIFLVCIAVLFFLSLVSYSPEDPNFIFTENTEIKNILGFKGSYISDLFFQSIGLIAFLISLTIFFTGVNLIINKKSLIIIENFFYSIIYTIFGSLFFSIFYQNSFSLYINGNGGFVGNFFQNTFLSNLINLNKDISYYFILILVIIFFLISVNFSIKYFLNIFKFFLKKIKNENPTTINNIQNENETIIENVNKPTQEDLPFNTKNTEDISKNKFKLPSIDYLKKPTKSEREKSLNGDKIDENTLEKILLDFGVEGKIKKVSQGPVVTLNEFEPAAGVKVSKIINLSEDIARNTSSESARMATIPGSNTIGIELPNSSRENVYLSEIISSSNFTKKDIKLPIALGKSISGIPVVGDLYSMPHLLIAGTTGSGKSVCINTIILSLLYKLGPDKCKFILIDPKMLELSTYEGIPHLLCPVITEAKRAASVLGWVVKEMESRYRLMTRVGVRNIDGYN